MNTFSEMRSFQKPERYFLWPHALPAIFISMFIFVVLCLFPHPAAAQADKLEYRLGPEDILEIYVDRHADLSRVVVVGPDGKISLPLIGDVMASGLTRTELQNGIAKKFEDFIKEPMVTVLIQSFNSFKVYVLGQVNRPGLYSLKGKPYLMEAISLASGLTDFANAEEVILKRGRERFKIDLAKYLSSGEAGMDMTLHAGDTIFVPRLEHEKKVFVIGEVNLPGAHDLKRPVSLLEALALAGSHKNTARLDDVVIERKAPGKKIVYHVNLAKVFSGADLTQNITIHPGDTIFVPKGSANKIMVLGQVTTPGVYEFTSGMTCLEGVSMAGSYTKRAVLKKAAVIRGAGSDRRVIAVDLQSVIHEGRLSRNVELMAGDVVYLPETVEPDWSRNILPMLESIQIGRDLVKNW